MMVNWLPTLSVDLYIHTYIYIYIYIYIYNSNNLCFNGIINKES
jgi:hypothetical protein